MIDAETALLLAVRDQIREACNYAPKECEVEFDEMAPATVGEVYVAVIPASWQTGDAGRTSGGVRDEVFGVEVVVIARATRLPRDRSRSLFIDSLIGINSRCSAIIDAIHADNAVMQRANVLLTEGGDQFCKPLFFESCDGKPHEANGQLFASNRNEQAAGMVRAVRFSGARRTRVRKVLA